MIEPRAVIGIISVGVSAALATGCIRGRLPAREFYRLVPPDSVVGSAPRTAPPPLSGSIAIAPYETSGIYASAGIVYRIGPARYGAYPSREWAIPLGEMLASLSESALRQSGLTDGRVVFDPAAGRNAAYHWRGSVREFDEVDGPASVHASVALAAQLVRAADDSVIWSGEARQEEAVRETRSMDAVVRALSAAAARAIALLADEAAAAARRLAAAGAHGR